MPPQEIAFAAPRAEEMTKIVTGVVGAGMTGAVEGIMVKMAPQMGAAAPLLTWGTLLGVPLMGGFGALFTRGMLGDLCIGIAAGGSAILGYSLPELMAPITGQRTPAPQGGGQLAPRSQVKQLPAGPAAAPQRAQARVGATLEF